MRVTFTVITFASVATIATGCPFDDATPPGAVLFCIEAADCPSALTCDVASHVCVAPGDDVAGPVVSASFSPPVLSQGFLTLVLEGDEPLAVDPPPVLAFLGEGAPPFIPVTNGGQARLELVATVDSIDGIDALPEGFYRLRDVSVADAKGNVATSPVNAFFEVDRTPPLLDDVVVTGGVFADQPGFNDVIVTFRASEPVTATASLGQATASCTSEASPLELTCALVIEAASAGLQEGANLLAVEAVDAAGNVAARTSVTLQLDVGPPGIVPGSIALLVDGSGTASFAALRDELELRFLTDDDLAVPPLAELDGGEGTQFVVDELESTGRLWLLRATIDVIAQGAPELRSISVRLVDDVGHESTTELSLPSPHAAGLRVLAVPESPCTIPPRAVDGSTCTDFDADGFSGPSIACDPSPRDCDDRDPAVHPTAREIAGDGVRNDCDDILGDDVLEGYFVDAAAGDDTAAGTATAPLASFNEARARALADPRPIILAAGLIYSTNEPDVPVSLYGGRDPTTWLRVPGAVSELSNGGTCGNSTNVNGDVIEGVRFGESLAMNAGGFARDVVVEGCDFAVAARALLIDVDVPAVDIQDGAGGTRMLGHRGISRFGPSLLDAPDLVFARVAGVGRVTLQPDAEAVFVNATLRATSALALITCLECSRLSIFHSNLIGDVATDGIVVDTSPATEITVAASQIRLGANDNFLDLTVPASITLAENVFDQPPGNLLVVGTPALLLATDDAGLAALEACAWSGCVEAVRNALGDVTLLPDGFGIDENAGASIARDRVLDVTLLGAPTFVAGDVDGTCRGLDSTSGPRELP